MATLLEDLKDLRIYNKKLYVPVNDDNRKEGSAIMLMSPDLLSSLDFVHHFYSMDGFARFEGTNNYNSFYMEKDVSYYINNEAHKMGRLVDDIILEDFSYKRREIGHLSQFKKVEIDEDFVDRYVEKYSDITGCIPYDPWVGYAYLTEDEKLVACINVNKDERTIERLFVTEDKYNYLYKELVQEARNLKVNEITTNNYRLIEACKEFGFSVVDESDGNTTLRFRVGIEEAASEEKGLQEFLSTKYKISDKYLQTKVKAISDFVSFYIKDMHLNKKIGILMSHSTGVDMDKIIVLYKDPLLRKYMSEEEIVMAYKAVDDLLSLKEVSSSIYSSILRDSEVIAAYTNIDYIIMNEVIYYTEDNGIHRENDTYPSYLLISEVEEIIDNIKRKYSKNTINDYILKYSYKYYNVAHSKVQSKINKGLYNRICCMYQVIPDANIQNEQVLSMLNESHVSLRPDIYTKFTNENSEIPKESNGFDFSQGKKGIKSISVKEKGKVIGTVSVDETGQVVKFFTEDKPMYLIMTASRKMCANKFIVPEECTEIIECLEGLAEWNKYTIHEGMVYFDKFTTEFDIPYDNVSITEDMKTVFSKLPDSERNCLGQEYLNPVCLSNTIYTNVIKEKAMVDVYVMPAFPKVGYFDIAVVKEHRGKGLATKLIRETIDVIKRKYPKIDCLGWTCDVNNKASYGLATKCGFIPRYEGGGQFHLFYTIHNTDMIDNTFTNESVEEYIPMEESTWYPENMEDGYINEDGIYMLTEDDAKTIIESGNPNYSNKFKTILWADRIRNNKDVLLIYDRVKEASMHKIRNMYLDIDKYKGKNLIIDFSLYNQSFFNNYKKVAGGNIRKIHSLYSELMNRLINDKRVKAKYKNRLVVITVEDWIKDKEISIDNVDHLNPISNLINMIKFDQGYLSKIDTDILIMSENGNFFKINPSKVTKNDTVKVVGLIKDLIKKIYVEPEKSTSKKAIVHGVLDKLETGTGVNTITINSITSPTVSGDPKTKPKAEKLVKEIEKAAETSNNPDEVTDKLDNSEERETINKIIRDLSDSQDGNVKLSAARSKRLKALNDKFLSNKVVDKYRGFQGTMRDYMDYNSDIDELPESSIPIESINEGWQHMKYINFEKKYNLMSDIYSIIYFFGSRSVPLTLYSDIKIEDTSTSEDWKQTIHIPYEMDTGTRFKIKVDIPILKDNRNMVLGGNDKTINGQLVLLPISKTDQDVVQIVSNYNKIFVRRYSVGYGKSTRDADRLIKCINIYSKEHPNSLKIKYGDSTITSEKYVLPFDYVDIGSTIFSITSYKGNKIVSEIWFNQDHAREQLGLKPEDDRMPIGYIIRNNKREDIFYESEDKDTGFVSRVITELLSEIHGDVFNELLDKIKVANRHCYSRASILAADIPIIVIMAYNEGLTTAMEKGHVNYIISEKRRKDLTMTHDVIKFKDAYIYYEDNYNSSLLMNGLKEIDTKDYEIREINNKLMWTETLDLFGGRIKADGLDNFYDLMVDPITEDVCTILKLPTDYCELLAYANLLLADNGYTKHTDLSSNRYRTNELIAGYFYKAMSTAYANFKNQIKRNRTGVTMTIKQSAVIDLIMESTTMSDLSIMNPNLEAEAKNSVSFKGHVGMNSDRSYSLDKRVYDETMLNKIAMSTGFAGNVGVTRQSTMDMEIYGARGFIKNSNAKDCSVTKTLSITEGLTPFGSTRDDPFRTAMTNIQTSKHNMRIRKGTPLLVSCGTDVALPYLTGDTFAFKAKDNGRVIKKNDDFMVVEYDNLKSPNSNKRSREIIDLRENVRKNSDGGFYITLKLDTTLKAGSRFKKMDILAYDKTVYSDEAGEGQIAYTIGALGNIAYLNTDEGFEDSAIISYRLADCLGSDVVVEVSKNLPANTNIFNIAKKGDYVQEGDTLMLYQTPFTEKDANDLVKKLAMTEKEVSELGRVPVKSKVTGIVQDIKLYRTVDYSEMSSSMKKLFKDYESSKADINKEAKLSDNRINLESVEKLPATSKMKNLEGKVKIEFYLKYNDNMGIGDKLVFMSAIKGETKTFFRRGEEPYTDRVPDEIIDSFCPLPSVQHRMVGSVRILTGLYKMVIELTRQMKEIMGIKYIPYNPRNYKVKGE